LILDVFRWSKKRAILKVISTAFETFRRAELIYS
jgi:hypothetical protein